MIKSKTIETIEEFDENGRLLKKTVTEREEADDSPVQYTHTSAPWIPWSYPIGTASSYDLGITSVCSENSK